MTNRVGFLGLGIMGHGMANNLLQDPNTQLHVWNRSTHKADHLKNQHAQGKVVVCASPKEVMDKCDLVYAMLSTPDVCKAVYEMDGGVLSGVRHATKLVDCATLAQEDMERLAAQVAQRGGRFLAAPVSGSKGPAAAGQLIFLAGGDEALFKEIESTHLSAMGKSSFYFGSSPGAAAKMKLVVNMIMGTMMASLGEGIALCGAADLDAAKLLEVLDLGVCASTLFKIKGPKVLVDDHAPNFPLMHAQKDMRLAVELGQSVGLELPVAAATDGAMVRSRELGHSELDMSAVFKAQAKSE